MRSNRAVAAAVMFSVVCSALPVLFARQSSKLVAPVLQEKMPDALALPAGIRVVLRLTAAVSSDPKEPNTGRLVTVANLAVDDLVIIPQGSGASFTVTRKDTRRLLRPGELDLQVEGISTLTGQIVLPLSGTEHRVGDPGCYREGCLLIILFPWLKGQSASLPAGTLITARVSQATSFDRRSIERIKGMLM